MPLHIEKIVDHSSPIFTLPFNIGSKQISIEQDLEARRRPAFDMADDAAECDLTERDSKTGAVLWDGAVVAASLMEGCSNAGSRYQFRDLLNPKGKMVVELGCGCSALPGQVAATLGAERAVLTDLECFIGGYGDDGSVLRRNIERNGLSDEVDLLPHKWGDPVPADLSDVQLILAADCIYDLSLVEPLLLSISDFMTAAKANGNTCVALVTFDTSIGRHKAYQLFDQEARARFESVEFLDENEISRDGLATDSVKAYILSGLKLKD